MRYARSARARRAAGFTLAEVLVASALAAIVLMALNGVLLMASGALPERTASMGEVEVARLQRWLADDLRFAISVDRMSARSIEVSVPDRTWDGEAEKVTYEWSGVPGAPITRTMNGSEPEVMVTSAVGFALTASTEPTPEKSTLTTGPEVLLASCTTTTLTSATPITDTLPYAQHVPVSLPANAVSYRVERVDLRMIATGATDGQTRVEVRGARSGLPMAQVLAETVVPESGLSAIPTWVSRTLASPAVVDAGQPVSLVLSAASGSPSGQWLRLTVGGTAAMGAAAQSTYAGMHWASMPGEAFNFRLWGRVTTSATTAATGATRYVAVDAAVTVRAGVERGWSMALLNRPAASAVVAPDEDVGEPVIDLIESMKVGDLLPINLMFWGQP